MTVPKCLLPGRPQMNTIFDYWEACLTVSVTLFFRSRFSCICYI